MNNNFSQITNHIWIGGGTSLEQNDLQFDIVFVVAEELEDYAKKFARENKRIRTYFVPLDDHKPTTDEIAKACKTAVAAAVAVKHGKSVLFVCSAGLNRSAWIAAMTMMELGSSAEQAIAKIRRKRRHPMGFTALFNKDFLEVLRTIDANRKLRGLRGASTFA